VIYRHLTPAERPLVALLLKPTVSDHALSRATHVMATVNLVLA